MPAPGTGRNRWRGWGCCGSWPLWDGRPRQNRALSELQRTSLGLLHPNPDLVGPDDIGGSIGVGVHWGIGGNVGGQRLEVQQQVRRVSILLEVKYPSAFWAVVVWALGSIHLQVGVAVGA